MARITGHSVKQTATSESTPEAELVAAAKAMKSHGIPLLDLMEALCGRTFVMKGFEDNEATEAIIKNGYSPELRHMKRIHVVSIGRLNECYHGDTKCATMEHADTSTMKADIFTKPFLEPAKWQFALQQIGIAPVKCKS